MDMTIVAVVVIVILVILGALLAINFARRRRGSMLKETFGPEYDRAVEKAGSEDKAQDELDARRVRIAALNIRPLSAEERERYQAEWDAAQSNFVDEPGVATREADRLINEVMELRNYPPSSFDERAADISIQYPALVSNYRAAGAIAAKNGQRNVDTEDLRQSMIYYRAVFDELLKAETVEAEPA